MQEFENVLEQYEPMITHSIRKLNIYRDYEQYRQAGRVALWQAWTRFDTAKGDFTPFAYWSIRGAILDELKRASRYEKHVMPAASEELIDVIGATEETDFDFLMEVIEQLDANEKAFIQWTYAEQCSLAECAERFGISVAGVKKRRERLLKKLRAIMVN